MSHGTDRHCPLVIVPKERDMTRIEYRSLDHLLRSTWRQYGPMIPNHHVSTFAVSVIDGELTIRLGG